MTKVLDISHERGDSFSRILVLINGLAASSFDEFWFTVRSDSPGSSVLDDTGALSSGKLSTGEIAVTGISELTITIDNPDWPAGRLVYDVQGRTPAGQIFTVTKGMLRVYNDVTRSV